MRNEALERLDGLVGDWKVTLTDAWFLESRDVKVEGTAKVQWLGEAFLEMTTDFGAPGGDWHWVIGRNDAREQFVLLYHDDRGVLRVFDMTLVDGVWTLSREDPDFHQRIVLNVTPDRLEGRTDASEDFGRTWRKDFDLIFERR